MQNQCVKHSSGHAPQTATSAPMPWKRLPRHSTSRLGAPLQCRPKHDFETDGGQKLRASVRIAHIMLGEEKGGGRFAIRTTALRLWLMRILARIFRCFSLLPSTILSSIESE